MKKAKKDEYQLINIINMSDYYTPTLEELLTFIIGEYDGWSKQVGKSELKAQKV